MKFFKRAVYLFSFLSTFCISGGGDKVGNGGGTSEHNLTYSWLTMKDLLEQCLGFEPCQLSTEERQVLEKVIRGLPGEQKNLFFASGAKEPALFQRNGMGPVRIANTLPEVGAKIWVNTDLLYPVDGQGRPQPIDVAGAASILIPELIFHYGVSDENIANALASKIADILRSQISEINLDRHANDHIRLSFLDIRTLSRTSTKIILSDGLSFTSFEGLFYATLPCPTGQRAAPHSMLLSGPYWSSTPEEISKRRVRFSALGALKYECEGAGRARGFRGDFNLDLDFRFEKGSVDDLKRGKETVLRYEANTALIRYYQIRPN